MALRVMVVGNGGREHALCAGIARSPQCGALFCVPGNGGTQALAQNVALDVLDVAGIVSAARERAVDLCVVGPEAPLAAGLVDALEAAGILAFGPCRAAAQLESSKVFSKAFMLRNGVPTAQAVAFDDAQRAIAHVRDAGRPFVVKADGLAAGKGVIVASTVDETIEAIHKIMAQRAFGEAGAQVLLEQRLQGEEISYHVLLDGEHGVPLVAAQDHKRAFDGDLGPNTGGMGAYSPPPVMTAEVERKILQRVVAPTLAGLRSEGLFYRGVLFIGLMIDAGEPYVIEFNTRFGDPEMQVMFARHGGDLLSLLLCAARGELGGVTLQWAEPAALSVVVAAPGYPDAYPKGVPIAGLTAAAQVDGVAIQHAGTVVQGDTLLSAGGRVLTVTAHAGDIDAAAALAYRAIDRIEFAGKQYRRDIGHRARRKA